MAKEPVVLVVHVEIVLDDGKLKPGVNLDTIAEQIDTAVWGVVVPHGEIKATRKRCLKSKAHVHDGTAPCQKCVNYAYNERNADNV